MLTAAILTTLGTPAILAVNGFALPNAIPEPVPEHGFLYQLDVLFSGSLILQNQYKKALQNPEIKAALDRALYSPRDGMHIQDNRFERMTDSTAIRTFQTREGEKIVVIGWVQDNASTTPLPTHDAPNQSILFISAHEIVFIPHPDANDPKAVKQYFGMKYLYGLDSYRKDTRAEVIRAVSESTEVLELLGSNPTINLRYNPSDVMIIAKKDYFIVEVNDKQKGLYHHSFKEWINPYKFAADFVINSRTSLWPRSRVTHNVVDGAFHGTQSVIHELDDVFHPKFLSNLFSSLFSPIKNKVTSFLQSSSPEEEKQSQKTFRP